MKRITAAIAGLALAIAPAIGANVEFKNESINYKVMFKWGMVNKQAGHATLSIRNNGSQYITKLTAASESWADHFYKVRDTLNGIIDYAKFRPIHYERIAHEGSDHKHDTVNFSYVGAQVKGKCTRQKRDKKGNMVVDEKRELGAMGTTVDMLTSFIICANFPMTHGRKGTSLPSTFSAASAKNCSQSSMPALRPSSTTKRSTNVITSPSYSPAMAEQEPAKIWTPGLRPMPDAYLLNSKANCPSVKSNASIPEDKPDIGCRHLRLTKRHRPITKVDVALF